MYVHLLRFCFLMSNFPNLHCTLLVISTRSNNMDGLVKLGKILNKKRWDFSRANCYKSGV